jgi:hypothetical protein
MHDGRRQPYRITKGTQNMANEDGRSEAKGAGFSFAMRELRQAERARELALEDGALKPRRDGGGGCDPYNTSGSFDRRNNWARIRKR